MISDCTFAIQWMHTGKRPGNRRGIERRAAYQREKLMDPLRMQAYVQNTRAGSAVNLTDWQRFQIEDALSRLSARERECYTMAHGEFFSYGEISLMLGISKSSVQEHIQRAQKKISDDLMTSLFLVE
jgi:RNA polymerase sigma-70 factor (ECF subfamily)